MADSWEVAPSDARLRLVAERVIEVATAVGAGGGVGVGGVGVGVGVGPVALSPPHAINSNNTPASRLDRYIKPRHGGVGARIVAPIRRIRWTLATACADPDGEN